MTSIPWSTILQPNYWRGGPAYNCRQPFRRRQLYRFLRKP